MIWVVGAVACAVGVAILMGYRRLDRLEREERQRQWEEDIRRRLKEQERQPGNEGEWLYRMAEEERDGD
ncbi:MAG: hypothetical protein IKP40_13525 [Clostridia bacterium]|nr:hypothetical protein [Clostridia bacterium]